jgi:hypothetical protein
MDNRNINTTPQLVLSVFSGIDLLGKGFTKNGFCVVGGIDIIFDNDIRDFHPVINKFDGVIGGSPCQDFSKARRSKPTNYGFEMMDEFKRVVLESNCKWCLPYQTLKSMVTTYKGFVYPLTIWGLVSPENDIFNLVQRTI